MKGDYICNRIYIKDVNIVIKINIDNLLAEKNKSIYWLAENTDLSYTTVYNLVNNKTLSVHFKTLEKIMLALEIDDFNKILKIE